MSSTEDALNKSCCYYQFCYCYYQDNAASLESWLKAEQTCTEDDAGLGDNALRSKFALKYFTLMNHQPDNHRYERCLNIYKGTLCSMDANNFESINEENVSLKHNQVKHRIDVEKSRKY